MENNPSRTCKTRNIEHVKIYQFEVEPDKLAKKYSEHKTRKNIATKSFKLMNSTIGTILYY